MKNKKISSSLISYNIKKRRKNKIKLIVAQILLLIGLSVAGTIAYTKVRTDIMRDRAEYIELERCIDGTLATFCEEGWDVRQTEATGVEAIADKAPVGSVEEQIRRIAEEHNFRWIEYIVRLAKCESMFDIYAYNPTNNSHDRGIYQISRKWHPEISDKCAYDIRCSTEFTMNMINDGRQHEWACDKIIKL